MTFTFREHVGPGALDDAIDALADPALYERFSRDLDLPGSGVAVRRSGDRVKVNLSWTGRRSELPVPARWLARETVSITQEFWWSRYRSHIVGRVLVTSSIRDARFTGIVSIDEPNPGRLDMTVTGAVSIRLPWPLRDPALGAMEKDLLHPAQAALAETLAARMPVRR